MMAIHRLPQPVIAQVHGIATAAGCQLVAACDLADRERGCALRHARRAHRPLLLDADGRGLARRRPQARARDAAHRRADRRADGSRLGPRQPRRAAASSWRRQTLELAEPHHERELAHDRGRQGRVLRAARPRAARGLRAHERGHGGQHRRARRPRGHRRVSEQARAALARPRVRPSPGRRAGTTARRGCPTGRRTAASRPDRPRSGARGA